MKNLKSSRDKQEKLPLRGQEKGQLSKTSSSELDSMSKDRLERKPGSQSKGGGSGRHNNGRGGGK